MLKRWLLLLSLLLVSSYCYAGVYDPDLTASKAVFSDSGKKLTSTGPGASTTVVHGDGTISAIATGDLPSNQTIRDITYVISGGASVIATGIAGDLEIPFACTINRATLLADTSTSSVVNVWKQTYASYPATVTQKITASAPPTITATTKSQDSTLTGWTTSISAGDTLRFNVDSNNNAKRLTLSLKCTAT